MTAYTYLSKEILVCTLPYIPSAKYLVFLVFCCFFLLIMSPAAVAVSRRVAAPHAMAAHSILIK